MPVEDEAGSVAGHDLVHEHDEERVQQCKRLLARGNGASAAVVERTDRDGGGGRRGERELLLDDVVLPERDDEEHAVETRANGQSNQLADIELGQFREQVEPVHRRDGGDEEDTDTTGSGSGGLDRAVLLGPEGAAKDTSNDAGLREGLREGLDDRETENGLSTGAHQHLATNSLSY